MRRGIGSGGGGDNYNGWIYATHKQRIVAVDIAQKDVQDGG